MLATAADEEVLEDADADAVPDDPEPDPEPEPEELAEPEPEPDEPVWLAPLAPVPLAPVTTDAPEGTPPMTTVVEEPTETSKEVSEREMFWRM